MSEAPKDKDFYCETCETELEDGLCPPCSNATCKFAFTLPNKVMECGYPDSHQLHHDENQQYYHQFQDRDKEQSDANNPVRVVSTPLKALQSS